MHEDDAPVEQARQRRVPLRLVDGLVGAVPVEQGGGGAVERRVPVPHERRGDGGAVGGDGTAASRRRSAPGRAREPPCACTSCARAVVERDPRPHRPARRRTPPRPGPCAVSNSAFGPRRDRAGGELRLEHETRRLRGRRCGRIRSRCRPVGPVAEHHVAGEGVDLLEALGRVLDPHDLPRGVVLVAVARDGAPGEPELGRLVVGDQQQGLARRRAARSAPRGTARRGAGRPRSAAPRPGRARRRTHTSLVSRFSEKITTKPPERVPRTLTSNCSSGSSSTSSSCSAGVPIRCRQTWWGR